MIVLCALQFCFEQFTHAHAFDVEELPELARGKGNKIQGLPKKTDVEMAAICVLAKDQALRIISGDRHMTLKPKDLDTISRIGAGGAVRCREAGVKWTGSSRIKACRSAGVLFIRNPLERRLRRDLGVFQNDFGFLHVIALHITHPELE